MEFLIGAGGHPMAAGFTIETEKIGEFKTKIEDFSKKTISPDILEKSLKVDCELKLDDVSMNVYDQIQKLAPFGIGNFEPVFWAEARVEDVRTIGKEGKHLKMCVSGLQTTDYRLRYDAIGFNFGDWAPKIKIGDVISIAYCLDLNVFNGTTKLQLKVKDLARF
jgi:single-stranded-DNA-specific exonuclease